MEWSVAMCHTREMSQRLLSGSGQYGAADYHGTEAEVRGHFLSFFRTRPAGAEPGFQPRNAADKGGRATTMIQTKKTRGRRNVHLPPVVP